MPLDIGFCALTVILKIIPIVLYLLSNLASSQQQESESWGSL